MEIVLKKDYDKLGKIRDIITVKDGFARNYLIPQGIAVPATEGNKKAVEESKKIAIKRGEKKIREARKLAKKIEEVPCTIPVKVKQDDEIYGSVTVNEIAEFLKKEGFKIEKTAIQLADPIKQLGVYNTKIKLYKDIFAKLKIWVVNEEA
jgi:large subunit ribosomal protein L9